MNLPPNIDAIRAKDPGYASELEAFAKRVQKRYGPQLRELLAEEQAIDAAQLELQQRRAQLRRRYQELNAKRRDAGMHRFPPPPPRRMKEGA